MNAIIRTTRTVTLSEIPFAITAVLARNARREARRARLRRFLSAFQRLSVSASQKTHSARIGRETIESNLPLR